VACGPEAKEHGLAWLSDGSDSHVEEAQPIGLTMPDNRYWGVGEYLGAAWSAGKSYQT
jgi:hypothetical protein